MFCQIYHYSDYCVKSYVDNSTKSKVIRPSNLFSYYVDINVKKPIWIIFTYFLSDYKIIKIKMRLCCMGCGK
jgi:hypothetical protein